MNVKGVRVLDQKDGKCITLHELLDVIAQISQLNWAILWLDVTPISSEGYNITSLMKEINSSEGRFLCDFSYLRLLSEKIFQEINLLIIGAEDSNYLHVYENDQTMYESCDITIEMIDGGFWEIFCKNEDIVQVLLSKFTDTEILSSDFQDYI